jgi:hypothetical protein
VVEQNGGLMSDNWWKNKKPYVKMANPSEILGCEQQQGIDVLYQRRLENLERFAGRTDDPEAAFFAHREKVLAQKITPIMPPKSEPVPQPESIAGWPFKVAQAQAMQTEPFKTIQVGNQQVKLMYIPAGSYVRAGKVEQVNSPFYMAETEVSNALYAQFDATHDSKYKDMGGKDQRTRGIPLNKPTQPVVRISAERAQAFCAWLSEQTGQKVSLPTQAQWEWSARAGSDSAFWFGSETADFSAYANLADQLAKKAAPYPIVKGMNDRNGVAASIDSYKANPWGLKNMHGNVAEWAQDGNQFVACGGSWQDRPHRAASDSTVPYQSYQPVMNVGFRFIVQQ